MKKIYTIALGIILCLGLVSAGIIGTEAILKSWNKDITLDQVKVDRIKLSSNVSEIDIDVNEIVCNNLECWANIKQPRVINTQWRRSKSYCSKYSICEPPCEVECISYSECKNDNRCEVECLNYSTCPKVDPCEIECLAYTDYTLEENKEAIKDYTNERLSLYANAEKHRKGSEGDVIVKSREGKIGRNIVTQ
jgi:hypothetical protein